MSKLAQAEQQLLHTFVSALRGYHLALIGPHRSLKWLPKNRLHNFTVAPHNANVLTHYDALPFRNNSLDVVFLPYELDHCKHKLHLLEELHRSLLSNGKLYIFTRPSWHPLNWFKRSLSLFRLKHLLDKAGFEFKYSRSLQYASVLFIEAHKQSPAITPIRPLWEKKMVLQKEWQPTTRESS